MQFRILLAAAILLLPAGEQDLPVVRLSSGEDAGQPAQPRQRSGGGLAPLPATQIDGHETALDSPRRLTLSFAEPRPIDEALRLLMAGTPFSVAIDADARGSFRGELKQLTLREALTAMLAPLGLDFDVRGTVIRVRRRALDTRLFDLNLHDASGVAAGIKALLSDGGRVHVDARAGVAQVTDYSDRLDRVALYVDALHRRSGRQVRLQAQAFEVMLRDTSSIDWAIVRQQLGMQPNVPRAGLAGDPAALRAALLAQGEVRTLWAPEVTTINNAPAMVRISTGLGASLKMTVVPQIAADGVVQLSLSHAWEEHAGGSGAAAHLIAESETVTRVMDGNTMMIAGLLRAAPAMAGVASRHAELVVLLRPTVVDSGPFAADSNQR